MSEVPELKVVSDTRRNIERERRVRNLFDKCKRLVVSKSKEPKNLWILFEQKLQTGHLSRTDLFSFRDFLNSKMDELRDRPSNILMRDCQIITEELEQFMLRLGVEDVFGVNICNSDFNPVMEDVDESWEPPVLENGEYYAPDDY